MTSAGRSISTQCPAPSMITLPRMSVTHLSIWLTQPPPPNDKHGVPLSGDEERRLFDLRGLKLRRRFDVAVNVPVPIQRPAKAALLVLRDVVTSLEMSTALI